MSFRPGWYEISFDPKTFRKRCRYFISTSAYIADCYLEPNGAQIRLWQDPQGMAGPGRPAEWKDSYRALPNAEPGDGWDNPPGGEAYQPDLPGAFTRSERQASARELAQRASCADASACTLDCVKEINVGIFFDGTNNNMERDREDASHSNVVSLYDAHKQDGNDHFRYYIPGVGAPFPQIGENREDPSGKCGEARIHYAMLQVFNAACRASTQMDLAPEASSARHAVERVSSDVTGSGPSLAVRLGILVQHVGGYIQGLAPRPVRALG